MATSQSSLTSLWFEDGKWKRESKGNMVDRHDYDKSC